MIAHADLVTLLRKHKASAKFKHAVTKAMGWTRDEWYANWTTIAPAIEAAFLEVFP